MNYYVYKVVSSKEPFLEAVFAANYDARAWVETKTLTHGPAVLYIIVRGALEHYAYGVKGAE